MEVIAHVIDPLQHFLDSFFQLGLPRGLEGSVKVKFVSSGFSKRKTFFTF